MNFKATASRLQDISSLVVLMTTSSLMALIFTVPAPLLFRLGQEKGDWVAQGFTSFSALGIILGGPVAAWLGRKFSVRMLLLPALFTYGAVGPLAMFLHSVAGLLASRLLLGFAAAVAVSASISMISERYAERQRMAVLGIQGGIASLFGLGSLWVAGGLASTEGWRTPFMLYLFAWGLLAIALPTFRETPEEPLRPSTGSHAGTTRTALSKLWPIFACVIPLYAAGFSTGLQLSFRLGDVGIADPLHQRNIILFSSLTNSLTSLGFGVLLAAASASRIFKIGAGAMMVGAIFIGSSSSVPGLTVGSALMGAGSGLIGPYLIGRVTSSVGETERAGAVGFFYSCIFLGEFFNPLFMQPIRQVYGSGTAFLAMSAVVLVSALVVSRAIPEASRLVSR